MTARPTQSDPTARLAGRTAIVTGAGAGIGAATARCLAEQGASVMLVDANEQALTATADIIRRAVAQAKIASYIASVCDETAAHVAVAQAVVAFGGLDILINNAAMRNYSAAAHATPGEWQALVNVNLVGMSNYVRAALPSLRAAGAGCIVNVSSCYAVTGRAGMAIYDATKAAQLAYTRSLAFEEAAHKIRVNAVCPGSTLTDFHVKRARETGKSIEQLATERKTTSLLGRWAQPEEIALPIAWLCSAEASFITGTTLMVDGGLHIM